MTHSVQKGDEMFTYVQMSEGVATTAHVSALSICHYLLHGIYLVLLIEPIYVLLLSW